MSGQRLVIAIAQQFRRTTFDAARLIERPPQVVALDLFQMAWQRKAVAHAPAQTPTTTKIQLTELHCQGCLKKLAGKLTKVNGVASVQGDLKAATLTIAHKPGMNPSPRALWNAVEEGDHTPTRLESPSGVYTTKPAQ